MTDRAEKNLSAELIEASMAACFAVVGIVVLYSLLTGDVRYIEGAGEGANLGAWSMGVAMIAFAIVAAIRLCRRSLSSSFASGVIEK